MNVAQEDFCRSMKGAPFSVWMTLLLSGASMTNLELCRATKYSDKLVTEALIVLAKHGFVQHNGRLEGWSIPTAIQLPLHLFPHERATALTGQFLSQTPEQSPYAPPTPEAAVPANALATQNTDIVTMLLMAGVAAHSKKMRELLEMNLTPSVIQTHVQAQAALGKRVYPTGHLITNLMAGSPPPETVCDCGKCQECVAISTKQMFKDYPQLQN